MLEFIKKSKRYRLLQNRGRHFLASIIVSSAPVIVEAAPRLHGLKSGAKHGPSWFLVLLGLAAFVASAVMFKEFVLDVPDDGITDEGNENDPPPKGFFILFTIFGMFSGLYMIVKGFMGGW